MQNTNQKTHKAKWCVTIIIVIVNGYGKKKADNVINFHAFLYFQNFCKAKISKASEQMHFFKSPIEAQSLCQTLQMRNWCLPGKPN